MSKTIYNKLVRDKIPEIIEVDDKKANTRTLKDGEYLVELARKLQEEAEEFIKDASINELADIKEILIAMRESIGVSDDALENARRQKADERGGFRDKIFLESVEE